MLAVEEPISTVLVIVPSLPEAVDKGDDEAAGVVSRVAVDELPAEAAVLVDRPLTKSGSLIVAELCVKEAGDVCTLEEPVIVSVDVNVSEAVSTAVSDDIWLDKLLEVSSGDKVLVIVDENAEERLVGTVAEVSDGDADGLNAEIVDEMLGALLSVMAAVEDSSPGRIEAADDPALSPEDAIMVVALVRLDSEVKPLLDSTDTPIVVDTDSPVRVMVALVSEIEL